MISAENVDYTHVACIILSILWKKAIKVYEAEMKYSNIGTYF